jgi:hypothetical protein
MARSSTEKNEYGIFRTSLFHNFSFYFLKWQQKQKQPSSAGIAAASRPNGLGAARHAGSGIHS